MEEEFKEFQAKDLDTAISMACEYFDTERAKLEIEILQDAKSGIFGIVGVRKAKIRAKRVHVREAVESILGKDTDSKGKSREKREKHSAPRAERPAPAPASAAAPHAKNEPAASDKPAHEAPATPEATEAPESRESQGNTKKDEPRREQRRHGHGKQAPGHRKPAAAAAPHRDTGDEPAPHQDFADSDSEDSDAEGYPHTPLENLDRAKLLATVEDATRKIVLPIAGEPKSLEVAVEQGRVQVRLDCGEDSGLLIGREGMTLAATQYIISRVVSCIMDASVRVQLDAGDYRRHQEEKLREMAQGLAERARQTGRSYSTRPLSSYHRRIVHLALQGMDDIQSRSSGEGTLKRVVISRRRPDRAERAAQ